VVDDGSTDDTETRVRQFGDRVRYLRKENGGQASAFNAGVSVARGQFVALLDADDYFYPTKLERVAAVLGADTSLSVVYDPFDVVDREGNVLVHGIPAKLPAGDLRIRTLMGYVPRRVLERLPIPEARFRLSADFFLLNVLPLVGRVAAVDSPLHAYRDHGENRYWGLPVREQASVHEAQVEAVWAFAAEHLGESFLRAPHRLLTQGGGPIHRLAAWGDGAMWLLGARVPLGLGMWTLARTTALAALPRGAYEAMRRARDGIRSLARPRRR
jgi:glycosyltransferase involved in cell wall biosynthesis